MANRDYYDVLGLDKSASDQEIKKAYRRLAKKYHPDMNPGDANAEKIFKEVTEAYNVLSDKEKKKLYDQFGHAAFDGSMGENPQDAYEYFHRGSDFGGGSGEYYYNGNMDDIFENMFGDFFAGSKDVNGEITISLKEAALGCEKVIRMGNGGSSTLAVKVPAGIGEGQTIRLKGKGKTDRRGKAGDLLIQVHVRQDKTFKREGNDVYVTQSVPYTTAILGGEVNVATLYGTVRCKVPAGSQAGSKLRLKNKGIVSMKNRKVYGDEYVVLSISVPKHISERERNLLEQLRAMEERKTA